MLKKLKPINTKRCWTIHVDRSDIWQLRHKHCISTASARYVLVKIYWRIFIFKRVRVMFSWNKCDIYKQKTSFLNKKRNWFIFIGRRKCFLLLFISFFKSSKTHYIRCRSWIYIIRCAIYPSRMFFYWVSFN